jgi:peptidylprolyl isomerase
MDFAEFGDIVTVEYSLRYTSGKLYDSNIGQPQLRFKLGSSSFLKGVESQIKGMQIGDVKTVTIKAEDAFGKKVDDLIHKIPKSAVPKHINTIKGQRIEIAQESQKPLKATIIEATDDFIIIDANLEQAGKDLVAMIKLIDIELD